MNLRTLSLLAVAMPVVCSCGVSPEEATAPVQSSKAEHKALTLYDPCAHDAYDARTWYPTGGGSDPWAEQSISSNGATYGDGDGFFTCRRFIVDLSISHLPPSVQWPFGHESALVRMNFPPADQATCLARVDRLTVYQKDQGQTEFTQVKSATITYSWSVANGVGYCTPSGSSSFSASMPAAGTSTYRYTASVQVNGAYQPVTVRVGPQIY